MIAKGQRINERYEIIRTIGEGGMANVYLAHDIILDRDVAVKVLRGDLADDDKFVRRFQREAISASSLSHPNIVEMYDVGEDDGQYYIVMEYVDGKTLKNLIKKRGALSIPETIDIMLQLTSGIAHAHDSYIIHRDIKPQNIMILDNGMVKITDFGIAMAMNNHEVTQTNSVMGSVHYLPPEQANGSGSTIKSDIYSLGILMFELLTGKIPFKGENAVEIAIKQMKEQIPSIVKINPSLPQSLENVILKSTAKNPKNRYESARDMYADIQSSLDASRTGEKRIMYKFPEQELEKTKKMPAISHFMFNKKETGEEVMNVDHDNQKTNKILIVTGIICLALATFVAILVIIYPIISEVPEVKIPDVSKMTAATAELKLEKLGFHVANKDITQSDKNVDEGKVIRTSPMATRSVKLGSTVTLVVSTGAKSIVLADYVGQNYFEIKALLEANGLYVITKKDEVVDITTVKENIIMAQLPLKDTKLVEGDTVTLTIPNITTEYPDFTDGTWTVDDVQTFATQYKLILTIKYEESTTYTEGKIIAQSRPAKGKVVSNVTLSITVSTAPSNDIAPGDVITE